MRRLIPLFTLAALFVLQACADPVRSTQVMAIIDAEEAVLPHIAKVKLTVYGSGEGEPPIAVLIEDVNTPDFPIHVAMVPLGDDASRIFGIEARAFDDDNQPQLISRARGTYVKDDARTVYLRFDEACLGVLTCGADETCSLGLCVDAWVPSDRYGRLDGDGEVPLPPIPVLDELTTASHEPITFNPVANDLNPAGGSLELVSIRPLDPTRGDFQILPSGEVEFIPAYTKAGLTRAIYTVRNSEGGVADGLIIVHVNFLGSPLVDSDGDGISDAIEVASGCLDPFDTDTDDDGIPDGIEDFNRDGIVDLFETDPCNPDSDGDGLCDGPRADNDGDGIIDPPSSCTGQDVMYIAQGSLGGDGLSWETAFGSILEAKAAPGAWIRGREFHITSGSYLVGDLNIADEMIELHGGFFGNERARDERIPLRHATILNANGGDPLRVRVESGAHGARFSQLVFRGNATDGRLLALADGAEDVLIHGSFFIGAGSDAALTLGNTLHTRIAESFFAHNTHSAIAINGAKEVVIEGSLFAHNAAPALGGAISAIGSTLTIDRSRFAGNTAVSGGSGVYVSGSNKDAHRIRVTNSVFSHAIGSPLPTSRRTIYLDGGVTAELINLSIVDRGESTNRSAILLKADPHPLEAVLAHISHTTNVGGTEDPAASFIYAESGADNLIKLNATNIATKMLNLVNLSGPSIDLTEQGSCLNAYLSVTPDFQVLLGTNAAPADQVGAQHCIDAGDESGRAVLEEAHGFPADESSAAFDLRDDTGALDPGYHLLVAGPIVRSFNYSSATSQLNWAANAEMCVFIDSGDLIAGLLPVPNDGEGAGDLDDVLLCLGEGPPSYAHPFEPANPPSP